MIKNGEMDTVQSEATKAREITEYMTDVMFKLKELMKPVYNQPPAEQSSISHANIVPRGRDPLGQHQGY